MHKYLRAVGFSKYKTRKEIDELIITSVKSATKKSYTTIDTEELYAEYYAMYADRIGLCIRGEYTDDNTFKFDYYFPYLEGKGISSYEDISVEQQTEKLSFAGVIDDNNIGVSIIFYLANIITYIKLINTDRLPMVGTSLTFSALSTDGKILLPIDKNDQQIKKINKYNMRKSRMIAQARTGDETAIENLTIQDMDTYTVIRQKVKEDDVYSIVDTSFMPYGVECDLYAIIGEITSYEEEINTYTKEKVYILTLNVNDLVFDVCINEVDLIGELEIGRRFKGVIWLTGRINFPEEV